jgi:arylsulfatase
MALKEYKKGTRFPGVIGRTYDRSEPAWPEPNRPGEDVPNVLFIVLDDVGFAQLGCYGSPMRTPNINALADDGLRYTSMHTTALCSPSRSCILTGRNHHSNHMSGITEISLGYPGADGNIPFENGFLSEILLQRGYSTFAVGKWHLTPAEAGSPAGPYERWPLGRGFERYYGFLGGDTHQYYPELIYDNHQVEPPKTPEEGYHFTEDMTDKAISFIADSKQIAPNKPFLLYYAPGAMHAPHHVAPEWADRYKGEFDDGWSAYREKTLARMKELGIVPEGTELSRHDPDVPDWDTLSADEKGLYARMMEVFAGFLEHTDDQIGRLIDFLKLIGEYENTLIMLISDNGASAEGGPPGSVNECKIFNNVPESLEQNLAAIDDIGGPKYFNHYPWGWTHAGNTPFRRWKRETYRGGVTDPFIVTWPKGIEARGEIRTQYAHAIDMVPTVLAAAGIEPPETIRGATQSPLEGVSMTESFEDASAPTKHLTQYYEMFGHRSIYQDGWRAVCPWPGTSFTESGRDFGHPMSYEALVELDHSGWELYHVAKDVAENHNVADQHRDRLMEMIAQWYVEAGKYNVLPIDSRSVIRFAEPRPQIAKDRDTYVYYPRTQSVPANVAPKVFNRPYVCTAEVEIPDEGAEGVLMSFGGNDAGIAFYIKDKKLCFVHNYVAVEHYYVISDEDVPPGHHLLSYEIELTGKPDIPAGKGAPSRVKLFLGDKQIGEGELPITTPIMNGLGGAVTVGADPGSPVAPVYAPPFEFTGTVKRVRFDLTGEHLEDLAAKFRAIMARQ